MSAFEKTTSCSCAAVLIVMLLAFSGIVVSPRENFATSTSGLQSKMTSLSSVEKSQARDDNPDTRPFFMFHLGPPKTGTSSIQRFLVRHRDLFRLDDYETFHDTPQIQAVKACLGHPQRSDAGPNDDSTTCYQPFLDEMVQLKANIALSDENVIQEVMVKGGEKWKDFYSKLQQHFQVKVVLYYRRHFDRLVSLRKEFFYPREHIPGFHEIPSLVSYYETSLTNTRNHAYLAASPTLLVDITRDLEKSKSDNATETVIRNFYVTDVVEDFCCHAMANASHVCGAFPMELLPNANPTYIGLDYDSIVYEAWKQGILPQNITRKQARECVKRYQEEILNKTVDDLSPKSCLSPAQLEELRQASYDTEMKLYPP